MVVSAGNHQVLFAAFYISSFLVVLFAAIRFSKSERLSTGSVLLVLSITSFSTIVGSRLFTIPVADWLKVLISSTPDIEPGRSAIGGLLLGLASFIISVRMLGLGERSLVLYAWITPLALGVQKIGCFFNGCCYGITTSSVFGIVYPRGTNAHFNHLLHGLIGSDSPVSGKVIPVQLIEVLIYILIAWVVWLTRTRWKQKISIILFFFILLFSTRFLTEFIRDPLSSPFREMFLGIRIFQWFLVISAIVLLFGLFITEKYSIVLKRNFWLSKPLSLGNAIAYLTLISAMIFSFRGLFVFYERVSLCVIFIPSILFMGFQFLMSVFHFRKMYLKISLFAVPMLFMFPVMVQDTERMKKVRLPYYNHEVKSYRKVDIGTAWGKYYSTVYYNPHEGECGTSYTSEDYENVFTVGGAGYTIVSNRAKSIITKGINVFGGTIKENNLTSGESGTYFTGGLNPYIKIDGKWAGAGIGLYAGDLKWIIQRQLEENSVKNSLKSFPFMPQVQFRLGTKDILDISYSYGMNSYASFPVLINEISMGSGFGKKTDLSFRAGVELSEINENPFISGEFVLKKTLGLNFKYHFGTTRYNLYNSTNQSNLKSRGIFNIGANYRFGFEK